MHHFIPLLEALLGAFVVGEGEWWFCQQGGRSQATPNLQERAKQHWVKPYRIECIHVAGVTSTLCTHGFDGLCRRRSWGRNLDISWGRFVAITFKLWPADGHSENELPVMPCYWLQVAGNKNACSSRGCSNSPCARQPITQDAVCVAVLPRLRAGKVVSATSPCKGRLVDRGISHASPHNVQQRL